MVKINGSTKTIVLTIKEVSHLVVGLFDDLLGLLSCLYM